MVNEQTQNYFQKSLMCMLKQQMNTNLKCIFFSIMSGRIQGIYFIQKEIGCHCGKEASHGVTTIVRVKHNTQ